MTPLSIFPDLKLHNDVNDFPNLISSPLTIFLHRGLNQFRTLVQHSLGVISSGKRRSKVHNVKKLAKKWPGIYIVNSEGIIQLFRTASIMAKTKEYSKGVRSCSSCSEADCGNSWWKDNRLTTKFRTSVTKERHKL